MFCNMQITILKAYKVIDTEKMNRTVSMSKKYKALWTYGAILMNAVSILSNGRLTVGIMFKIIVDIIVSIASIIIFCISPSTLQVFLS